MKTYLGDGLYVEFDGFMYTLSTSRESGTHYVRLEDEVLFNFFRFIERAENVKITIENLKKEEG